MRIAVRPRKNRQLHSPVGEVVALSFKLVWARKVYKELWKKSLTDGRSKSYMRCLAVEEKLKRKAEALGASEYQPGTHEAFRMPLETDASLLTRIGAHAAATELEQMSLTPESEDFRDDMMRTLNKLAHNDAFPELTLSPLDEGRATLA